MAIRVFIIFLIFSNLSYAQLAFDDVADQIGVDYNYGDSEYGGGVSFADFDNDGWDDITYASENGVDLYFFKNTNGVFNLVTFNGISNTSKAKQVIWVDYDNDGDKDFFVTAIEGKNAFYSNDGEMNFTDISSTIGIFQTDLFTYGASFGDIDNDGDLDLFISNRSPEDHNYLYRNDSGIYVDITGTSGISLEGQLSFCSIFFDYDKDGLQDIYVSNDKEENINRLYKNLGDGVFQDVSESSNAGVDVSAMSTTLGDFNNDGWFDIYITNTPFSQVSSIQGNVLLKNNGDGTFTNVATETGTSFDSVGWGSVFLDADNDGLLDIYVSSSENGNGSLISSAFYHQQDDETFIIPQDIGFNTDLRESYTNAIGDINNDGKPEIVVGNDTDNNFLWQNNTINENNWLKVKLEGVVSNKDGIGNTIEINVDGQSQYRYTLAGEGYLSQNSFYEFFGTGLSNLIDYVKVTWTSTGATETFNNIEANQSITIKEGIGILNDNDYIVEDLLSIYPNPSNDGVFKLSTKNNVSNTLKVYDLSGRLIFNIKNLKDNDEFSLNHCKKGIYVANLSSGKKSSTIKLVLN